MMTIEQVTGAVVAWAKEVLPELQGTYDYPADAKIFPLPDAAAEIQDVELAVADAGDFPNLNIEQAMLRVYHVHLLLLVDPEPPDEATEKLTDFVDRLTASALSDRTLGGRVGGVAPTFRSTFTPPFVEFDDGTRGRLSTMEFTIGELIDDDDFS